jgi:hypothetical protein
MNNCMDCHRGAATNTESNVYIGPTSELCQHRRPKKFCVSCGGSHVCITCRLTTTRLKNTECSPCRRFRDNQAPIKQKEFAMKKFLDKAIQDGVLPHYTLHDRAIALGLDPSVYGNSRPDWVWMLSDRWIILEHDEAQHKGNTYSCERRRELQICNVAGSMPVFFLRFNPDTFKTGSKSARVKAAGETMPTRHAAVVAAIKTAVEQVNPTGLTFTKLFFDCGCIAKGGKHACKFMHSTTYRDHEEFLMDFQ